MVPFIVPLFSMMPKVFDPKFNNLENDIKGLKIVFFHLRGIYKGFAYGWNLGNNNICCFQTTASSLDSLSIMNGKFLPREVAQNIK